MCARGKSAASCLLLACAAVLSACGSASPASSVAIDPQADVSAAAANPVTVSPLPGTPDVSPASQISFLGPPGTKVARVRVVGSRSGVHGGVLRAYSTRTGESFLPAHPFLAGERVSVRASVIAANAMRAASTTFTIADQAAVSQKEFPIDAGEPNAVQHYSSAPALTPSTVRITTPARPGGTPGYLFMAPYQGDGSPGPMISEQDGGLVWFHPLPAGVEATNFSVQQYEGKPVLAWWQGRIIQVGFGEGEDVLYDSSYRQLASVRAGNGYHADLHAFRLTREGTAWIDAFYPIHMNLASLHGAASGILTDSVVQEVDVKTGLVMWEWHALGHIPIAESKNPVPASGYPWDYIHVNSAEPGSNGDVLISARNSWTVYDVNMHSGGFNWRLGGSHSSFRLGAGTRFYWQHDAEFQPGGLISLFDNGSDPPKEKQSRGLLLAPDSASHTVSLVKAFVNPTQTLLAESQGNTLSLPGGNWLLGYGRLPNFTEFDGAGHVLLEGTLGKNVQNFSTFLAEWRGRPASVPSLAVTPGAAGTLTVAASWNGATEVASWRVLAGSSPSALSPVASAPKTGFQSTITAATAGPYVAVQALDASGAVIGESQAITA
ncbi:MAG: arylsulfotransferase family protein [Solirubrobacteraceae bacterium]